MYKKNDPLKSFMDIEKDVLKLWKEKDIIQKNFDLNEGGKTFTF